MYSFKLISGPRRNAMISCHPKHFWAFQPLSNQCRIRMNFPSFEGIASMCYFGFLFFSGICSYVHFLITNYCSFVFTVYMGGVCTGIFIPGFGSTRTYETLNFIRNELSLLSCLTKVFRPNKLPSSIKKEPRAS